MNHSRFCEFSRIPFGAGKSPTCGSLGSRPRPSSQAVAKPWARPRPDRSKCTLALL